MCFIEFIGYGCGHSSLRVLRACPMTTQEHTNPICPQPPERGTMVTFACPTCARILHSRWVEVVTFEHQWMHERGTCGCPVVFPALQQPRMIGKPQMANGADDGDDDDDDIHIDPADDHARYNDVVSLGAHLGVTFNPMSARIPEPISTQTPRGKGTDVEPRNFDRDRTPMPPLSGEAKGHPEVFPNTHPDEKDAAISPYTARWRNIPPTVNIPERDDDVEPAVNIRLSSYFAAEWLADHQKLHDTERCACDANFKTYKPHTIYESDMPKGKALLIAKEPLPPHTVRYSDIAIWRMNEAPDRQPKVKWPTKPQDYGFASVDEAEVFLATELEVKGSGKPPSLRGPVKYVVAPKTDRQQGETIVGWPIGAGPEGGIENSHSPN